MIHPKTLAEVADTVGQEAVDHATAYSYRALLLALETYLNQAKGRDAGDVASELEHLARRVGRVLTVV